jgi:methylated-DNA-[protein]-cysteine S-methyltransferase
MNHTEPYTLVHDFVIGRLGIITNGEQLTGLHYVDNKIPLHDSSDPLANDVLDELNHYFNSRDWIFTIPVKSNGTAFQQRVWKQLQTIPAGKTHTYQEMAQKLKTSPRAIGGACRANPVPIIVPCHRVVAKSGLGGYDGDWGRGKVSIKQWLLDHEEVPVATTG